MGFFLSEENHSGYKQHLNLSALAWSVIDEDMRHFYEPGQASLSGFLNTVFANFYQTSKATVSFLMVPAREQLDYIFDFEEVKNWINRPIKEKIYNTVLSLRADDFVAAATVYPKGTGRKFRVNKENRAILEDLEDEHFYNNNVGIYLKAIFEDYARKPYHEREAIFYADKVNKILEAIEQKLRLRIALHGGQKYYVNPYALSLDKYSTFNFLVGFMGEAEDENDAPINFFPHSVRLTHIEDIKVLHSQSGRIPENKRAQIERWLNENGPSFAQGDKREFIVRFDEEGLALFNHHGVRAPELLRQLDDSHFAFLGTQKEIEDFFVSFGLHAQVFGRIHEN